MISRYNRKSVSHNLEIRGLSRSSLEHHPLPDIDDEFLPDSFLHDVKEAVSTYSSESSEDCQTVTGADIANSWSAIQSYTGTGVSTERSSVFSWGYDEFDKAASRQVQQMFEEIDELLYEGTAIAQMCGLQDECQQWKSRFPHLRILGSQVVTPTDEGYRWYSTPGSPASRAPGVSHRERESTELSVVGRKAPFSRPRSGKDRETSRRPSSQYDGSRDPEENTRVIAAEGLMEEYLAFDCKDMDEEAAEKRLGCLTRRHRLGFPPISPYRCMKEAVLDEVFDDVWRELVGCMEELIRRHWEGSISDDERNAVTIATSRVDSESPFMLFSALPVVLPRVTQSRVPPFTPNLQSQASRAQAGAGGHHYNLHDLIVIHGIPLQQRNLAAMDKTQEPEERPPLCPGSSAVPSSRPRPRRTLEQSSSSLSRPPQSARRRNPPPRTLHPITPGLSQSGTPGSMDEVIRGTRLPTASDRLSSPLMPLSRNNRLPPISLCEPEHSNPAHTGRHQQHRGTSSRAHSAVVDDMGSLPLQDRLQGPDLHSRPNTTHTFRLKHVLRLCLEAPRILQQSSLAVDDDVGSLPIQDRLQGPDLHSRPNTTHTFRSDTPYRRSFTVLDNINQTRPGRGSADSISIGVTGISLGISSSSFLDSFHHHPLGHSPIEDEEEESEDQLAPGLTIPVQIRSHSRGGFTSRSSRQGL
ncbi:Protein FAM149B1 [Acipenser ruthenus]|uniref:Protein FAM149B1 n=1 Tax=Acipenser ruthenus TaxID=7906 RepID=A0A444U705_ACIRT|nr:Protein FAM149B1 [Acipenser ruthenus]